MWKNNDSSLTRQIISILFVVQYSITPLAGKTKCTNELLGHCYPPLADSTCTHRHMYSSTCVYT